MQRIKLSLLALLVLLICCATVSAQKITTVAGGGPNGVSAGAANVVPMGMAVKNGNLYIASGSLNRVFKVDSLDQLTAVAGNGMSNSDGDGGPAVAAGVFDPRSVVLDSSGNMWIAESLGHVRKVDAAGVITLIAGTNSSGFSGDGGLATNANLRNASGLALDGAGNLFIADTNNHRIRRVDAVTKIITTYAGNGTATFAGDNGPATAASLRQPQKVSFDNAGNLLIADTGNNRIRRVAALTGIITTVAGTGVAGFSGDGGAATAAALRAPSDVTVDAAGNLWIADTSNNRIRRVDASTGNISTFNTGPLTLSAPASIAFEGTTLFVGNTNGFKVLRFGTNGCCTDIGNGSLGFSGENIVATAASLRFPNGVAFDAFGNLYVVDSSNNRIRRIAAGTGTITTVAGGSSSGATGDNGPATSALLNNPSAIAFDNSGNLFIADQNNFKIRRIDAATGIITTVAGNGTLGLSGDGQSATSAQISQVTGIAVDSFGNVFLADRNNHRIRKVAGGTITTFAGTTQGFLDGVPAANARLSNPTDVAVDGSGNVFIADSSNGRIRFVDRNGLSISTVAGGGAGTTDGIAATQASIDATGVEVDGQGNIYIAGANRQKIQRVDAQTRTISTLVGNGQFAFSGDDGPAILASLANPTGVAIDGLGNLAIADNNNHRVRFVTRTNAVPAISLGTGSATIDEGGTFALTGSFADADANTWTGTVNYGDGSGTTALPLNASKTFDLNHTYADNGTYNVSVAIDDGAGGRGTAAVSVNVRNVTPAVNAGANASINEGGTFSQTGSFTDPGGDTWTASVDYGDGSAIQTLALNTNKSFALSHVYVDNGTYTVTVSVSDDDSGAGQGTIQVTVNNLAPVISYIGGSGASVNENDSITLHGNFTDAGVKDSHTVLIKWGDGSADTSINLAAGELSFSTTHQYADDAPTATAFDMYAVSVIVTDKDSGSATGNTSIKVMNVAPVISAMTGPTTSVALGTAASVNVNYTDKGPLDTHSCIFAWSDGQPDTTVAGASGSCSATHSYSMPGTYVVGATVIDDDTGSAKSELTLQVNVTPTTSFLTAGGWILAPAGSFTRDPSLSGKANFGLNVKYLKDSNAPTGQTDFDFKAGNLNFRSTNHEWLVISGNKAQYRGSGTINGTGDYGFMVTVVDGNDAFRMVIWDKATDAVIFDNTLGQLSPQLTGGGNISIQSK